VFVKELSVGRMKKMGCEDPCRADLAGADHHEECGECERVVGFR